MLAVTPSAGAFGHGTLAGWLGAQGACDAGSAPWARARRDGSFMGSFVRCMHTSDIAPAAPARADDRASLATAV